MKKLFIMIMMLMVLLPLAGCRASGSIGENKTTSQSVNV